MLALLSALAIFLQSAAPGVTGVWKTQTDDGLIRIAPCGEAICGFVAGSERLKAQPRQFDVRNRDQALRNRPILGLLMMRLKVQGANHWGNGWIYNPDDGGTYKASIELTKDDKVHLKGCIAAFLCKTQVWTRVS